MSNVGINLFGTVFDESGNGFATDLYFGDVYFLDYNKKKAKYLYSHNERNTVSEYASLCLCVDKKRIISFPYLNNVVSIFDRCSGNIIRYSIPEKYKDISSQGVGIWKTVAFHDSFFGFGQWAKAVIEITGNDNIEYHQELYDRIGMSLYNNRYMKYPVFISEPNEVGTVIMVLRGEPYLINYNLITHKVDKQLRLLDDEVAVSACLDGGLLWIVTDPFGLIAIDTLTGKRIGFDQYPEIFRYVSRNETAMDIINCGENLLLYPHYANNILVLDKSTKTVRILNEIDIPNNVTENKFSTAVMHNECVYLFSKFDNHIYKFDSSFRKVDSIMFDIEAEEYFNTHDWAGIILQEEKLGKSALEGFCSYIVSSKRIKSV